MLAPIAFTSCQRFLLKNTPEAEIVPDTPKEEEFGDERIFAKEIEAFRKAMKKNVEKGIYNLVYSCALCQDRQSRRRLRSHSRSLQSLSMI